MELEYSWVLVQLRITLLNACLCLKLGLDAGRAAWPWIEGLGGRGSEVSWDDLGGSAGCANLCRCTGCPSS